MEDLLNPIMGKEIGASPYHYPGGDIDIINEVKRMSNANDDKSDDLDGKSSADESGEVEQVITPRQGMDLCTQLERLCLQYMGTTDLDAS